MSVKYSIIIPYYNSIYSLKRLLESIPKVDDIEVIVVDDNSTKNLNEYIDLVKGQQSFNHKFLRNDTSHKGAGVCRNIGINHAIGKWLLFADADDFFVEDWVKTIEKFFDSPYDVIYYTPISIDLESKESSNRHKYYENLIFRHLENRSDKTTNLLRYKYAVPWSKMIKRELVTKYNIKFDKTLAANDVMFSTKVGHLSKQIEVSKEVIYCVTDGKGTVSRNLSKDHFIHRVEVFIRYYKYLKSNLSRKEFIYLELSGRPLLSQVIFYQLGIHLFIVVAFKLVVNRIKLFDIKLVNLKLIAKRIKKRQTISQKTKGKIIK